MRVISVSAVLLLVLAASTAVHAVKPVHVSMMETGGSALQAASVNADAVQDKVQSLASMKFTTNNVCVVTSDAAVNGDDETIDGIDVIQRLTGNGATVIDTMVRIPYAAGSNNARIARMRNQIVQRVTAANCREVVILTHGVGGRIGFEWAPPAAPVVMPANQASVVFPAASLFADLASLPAIVSVYHIHCMCNPVAVAAAITPAVVAAAAPLYAAAPGAPAAPNAAQLQAKLGFCADDVITPAYVNVKVGNANAVPTYGFLALPGMRNFVNADYQRVHGRVIAALHASFNANTPVTHQFLRELQLNLPAHIAGVIPAYDSTTGRTLGNRIRNAFRSFAANPAGTTPWWAKYLFRAALHPLAGAPAATSFLVTGGMSNGHVVFFTFANGNIASLVNLT